MNEDTQKRQESHFLPVEIPQIINEELIRRNTNDFLILFSYYEYLVQQIKDIQETGKESPNIKLYNLTTDIYGVAERVLATKKQETIILKTNMEVFISNGIYSKESCPPKCALVANVATARHILKHGIMVAYQFRVFPSSKADLLKEVKYLKSTISTIYHETREHLEMFGIK